MTPETLAATQAAIIAYYKGERAEMWAILIGFLIIAALCTSLFVAKRDAFSLTFMSVVLAFGLVFSGIAVSLLVRDGSARDGLVAAVASSTTSQGLKAESKRVVRVVANYTYYRYAAASFVLIALLAFTFGSRDWLHGLACGLLAVAAAQMVIDHYSEERAREYHRALQAREEQRASVPPREPGRPTSSVERARPS